jgi:hypothetical protein
MKNIYPKLAAIILAFAAAFGAAVVPAAAQTRVSTRAEASARVSTPLNLAVLIQDDLVTRVGNEIKTTAAFIRELPEGSQVMVGYIRAGSLQVRQPFTTDLDRAARALRVPVGSASVAPYNPYVEVREALKQFPEGGANRNTLLLISDGLDISRGFDFTSSVKSLDLERAVREAKKRDVAIYAFYAPSAGLTSWNRNAVNFGQSALAHISAETGGRAFFQGTSFVTFDAYFERLSRALNERGGAAY